LRRNLFQQGIRKSIVGRPKLARALEDLATGDEFVIAEWDRAMRSAWDGLQIIKA
jgi:DNA invertase Pin-like site-specific DNA recombinase